MAARLPQAARDYLEQLKEALSGLNRAERTAILADTRTRLAKLPRRGRRVEDIYAQLGPVDSYAAKFAKVQPETLKVSSGHRFLTRILAWPIFAFALLTAAILLFAPGAVMSASLDFSAWFSGSLSFGYVVPGDPAWINLSLMPAVLVSLVPALFSLTPLIIQGKAAAWLQLLGAVVMSVVAVLAGAGIGLFLLPAVLLLWSQVLVPPVMMRNAMGRPGWVWRTVGTIVVVAVLAVVALAILADGPLWALVFPGLLLVPAIGHLLRWRWAEIGLISVGLASIVYAAVALDLITEMFLLGGVLFIVGHLGLAGNMWNRRSANLLALL